MSKKRLFALSMARNAASKVVDHLILEGIEHIDVEIHRSEVSIVAFVRDYMMLDNVRLIMKMGGYADYEYKETEGTSNDHNFMMCETHYKFVID